MVECACHAMPCHAMPSHATARWYLQVVAIAAMGVPEQLHFCIDQLVPWGQLFASV
jgi:hypothetical protein